MQTRIQSRFLPVLLAGFTCLSSLQADVISFNFVRGSDGVSPLAPTDVAGFVPAPNWNNSTIANANGGAGVPLIDDSGMTTGATADWLSGGASWSVATTGAGSPGDMLMMAGYLDQDGDGNGQIHTITINDVPYANYDVYLYHSSAGGPNRTARYQANGIDLYTRNLDPADAFDGFVNAEYATLDDAALAAGNPAGNYVVWEGLSGATLSIEGQGLGDADGGSGGNTRRAPIQGIQIVEVIVEPGLPEVESLAPSAVGVDSATANGDLILNGDGADTADLTIYWGPDDEGMDPLAWANSTSAGSLSAPGTFSAPLTGLMPNTTYYYRAFASNSVGDDWGSISQNFTTLPLPQLPEVQTLAATLVGMSAATANGDLLNNGEGADTSNLTIYWGTTDGGDDALAWTNNTPAGSLTAPGAFSAVLGGLTSNTVYFYRAFASNSAGDDWAPTSESFATQPVPANAISLNFVRGSSGETPLDPTDVAGFVPASNWNNAAQANANAFTGLVLVNDVGVDSGATVDWQSGSASWSVATAGTGTPADMKMMSGYLDQAGDGAGQIHTVTVSNIPYGTYDLYLYHSSSGGPNRTARFRANGTDIFTRNLEPANQLNDFIQAGYATLAEAALAGGNPAGNFVVWTGLSGDLSIEAEGLGDADGGSGGNTRRAPIQGIQIVSAGPPVPFEITDIISNAGAGTITLVWNSEPGVGYGIDASFSMDAEGQPEGWFELDDFQANETISTYEHTLPVPAGARLYYRIRKAE